MNELRMKLMGQMIAMMDQMVAVDEKIDVKTDTLQEAANKFAWETAIGKLLDAAEILRDMK